MGRGARVWTVACIGLIALVVAASFLLQPARPNVARLAEPAPGGRHVPELLGAAPPPDGRDTAVSAATGRSSASPLPFDSLRAGVLDVSVAARDRPGGRQEAIDWETASLHLVSLDSRGLSEPTSMPQGSPHEVAGDAANFKIPIDRLSDGGRTYLLEARHPRFAISRVELVRPLPPSIEIWLKARRHARIDVVTATGAPVAGADVWLWQEPSFLTRHAAPEAEVRTDATGSAWVEDLARGASYRVALAPSMGVVRPMGHGVERLQADAESLRLVISSGWLVWLRPIDSDTGATISTARAVVRPGNGGTGLAMAHRSPGDRRVLGLPVSYQPGDYEAVMHERSAQAGEELPSLPFARIEMAAPGYESQSIDATARPLAAALASGPQRVPLRRMAPLGRVVLASAVPLPLAGIHVELRPSGGRTLGLLRRLQSPPDGEPIEFELPAGRWDLFVQDVRAESDIEVVPDRSVAVHIGPASWRPMSLEIVVAGKPYDGIVDLLLMRDAGTLLFADPGYYVVAGNGGRFALPAEGAVILSGRTPDGEVGMMRIEPREAIEHEARVVLRLER